MSLSVLLVDADRYESDRLHRLLEARHHRVATTAHFDAALATLPSRHVDVIVVDWSRVPRDTTDVAARFRQAAPGTNPFVIAVIAADLVEPLKLFERGVDDFVRRPVPGDDLVARVEAPMRHRRHLARSGDAAPGWAQALDARRVPGWADLDRVVTTPLSQLLSRRVRAVDAAPGDTESAWSEVLLAVPDERVGIRLLVRADLGALLQVSQLLLGTAATPVRAELDDVLGEIANTLSGALRSAARGVAMTASIAAAAPPTSLPARANASWVRRSLEIEGVTGRLEICLLCVSAEPTLVATGQLEEGMVIARDVFSGSGGLLVAAGARVTTTTAGRLARALGRQFTVEVASAWPGAGAGPADAAMRG